MSLITAAQKEQFAAEGYFILESAIPQHHIDLLRGECQAFIDKADAQMDAEGTDHLGLNHRNSRYFVSNCFRDQPRLREFLFSDLMAEICQATLGDDVYLFWEQYVVKGAEAGKEFSWHQDSGYVGYPEHKRYLTCWCALDDMSEQNGTVHLLPFSRAGIRTWVHHIRDEESGDKIGYFGSDPGVPVVAPAGSIAVFTSYNFHSSGTNTTDKMRRVYLAQYSCEPLASADGSKLWGNAEPFLKGGESVVGQPAPEPPYSVGAVAPAQ
ncbi:phytanoyl-CoA dioxygenase family protein [bacterium]|nr:phytanoyl-CoA dioxygenase [Gemmatimonadota bacterium]MCH2660243.1 phytanoyl-CoA dioxygenase family protein [bacterium]